MTVIVIQNDQIESITERGITYHDESGNTGFIDFEVCYQNYLQPRITQKAYEDHINLNPNHVASYEEYVA